MGEQLKIRPFICLDEEDRIFKAYRKQYLDACSTPLNCKWVPGGNTGKMKPYTVSGKGALTPYLRMSTVEQPRRSIFSNRYSQKEMDWSCRHLSILLTSLPINLTRFGEMY